MHIGSALQNVSILHTFDVKKNTKRLQKKIKVIWIGREGPSRPLEQGKSGRTNVFVFFFTQNLCTRLVWRHQPPSFIIMASQGALAPRLARSIRALGHPYSSMWGTNTSPKRGDRILAPHKRGMGSIAIVIHLRLSIKKVRYLQKTLTFLTSEIPRVPATYFLNF